MCAQIHLLLIIIVVTNYASMLLLITVVLVKFRHVMHQTTLRERACSCAVCVWESERTRAVYACAKHTHTLGHVCSCIHTWL